MQPYLEYFLGASLDPVMWVTIILCTRIIKKKTIISALVSTFVYVGGWGLFRFIALEIMLNEFWLIMSIVTTLFWGLVVGFLWNKKRIISESVEIGSKLRNEELAEWGKTVPLTPTQQEVMWEIFTSVKDEVVPSEDPLEKLTEKDKEYITGICSSGFRPRRFGNCDSLRLAMWRDLREKGYEDDHAAIFIGMMFNMVGRNDL